MPTPPARWTSLDFWTRSLTPRSQTTILPRTLARSSVPGTQIEGLATDTPVLRARAAATSGAGPTSESTVALLPAYFARLPRTTVPAYGATVLAATVVSQGATCSRVDGPGPLLPAEADTKMPPAAADRNAWSTGSYSESLLLTE